MEKHRLVPHCGLSIEPFGAPFSSFDYVEDSFQGSSAIHRCFSLARSFSAETLIAEKIPATGLIAEENGELIQMGHISVRHDIVRLSFWKSPIPTEQAIDQTHDDDLIGYAILKLGPRVFGGEVREGWHIFEAVFRKYEHSHNCVPRTVCYRVRVGEKIFTVQGVLYCQQNGLNKACAHVALRTLLSRLVNARDVSYTEMNKVARGLGDESFMPGNGLVVQQMQAILEHYGIKYRDVDYDQAKIENPDVRTSQPYQKYLYAGIESGCGGLLGFSMDGPGVKGVSCHIVPFYGHTFNKDTWVPDAQEAYFNIGGGVGYIPSESWTSSFIGHDDNFGLNFCVPRLYVRAEHVQYVVEIMKQGVEYSGVSAEALALKFLYSLYAYMDEQSLWQKRLAFYARPSIQAVVLRAIAVSRELYIQHLQTVKDWNGQEEDSAILDDLNGLLPETLWVVEVSLPHLFPANERKLGEIVLDATRAPIEDVDIDFGLFVLARLPGQFFLNTKVDGNAPNFATAPSGLKSHVGLIKQCL